MFPSIVHFAFATLILSATTVSANTGLLVTLSAPSQVNGVLDLKVVATVTNTDSNPIKLLKNPFGVLHTLETDKFTITRVDTNASPAFIGARVQLIPPAFA